jgi:aminoglycoside/choline kinase family phosphotransferase
MTGTPPVIAVTPDAITPAWLTDVLTRSGHLDGVQIVDVDVQALGTGQMCDSVRLTLRYDRATDAPSTVIAKLPAADPTSRGTALAMRSYEKEVRFYQELAPQLDVRTPGMYYADIDVTTAAFVLLLEDLAPAEQGDQLAGCPPEVAALAVRELVGLHAPRWDDRELTALDWLYGDPAQSRAFALALLPTLWIGFRERYTADLERHVIQAGDLLFAGLDAYIDPSGDVTTVVHGDYRLDNLLFDPRPGGTRIAVVDWQTCAVGPAASDVAYFIGAGLREDDRRAVEAALVRDYHGGLVAAGVDGYGWDRCWRDYRRGTWAGLLMAVGASMLVERTDRGDQMFLTMASRHARHALDLDAAELLTR